MSETVDAFDFLAQQLVSNCYPQAMIACSRHGELYRIEYAPGLDGSLEELLAHARVIDVVRERLPRPRLLDELCPLCAERVFARRVTLEGRG